MANDVSSAVHRIAKCGMRNMRSSRDYHHSGGFGFVYGDTATLPRFPHKLSNKIYNATLNDNTTVQQTGLARTTGANHHEKAFIHPQPDFPVIIHHQYCLQCFHAVGWAAGRASGL